MGYGKMLFKSEDLSFTGEWAAEVEEYVEDEHRVYGPVQPETPSRGVGGDEQADLMITMGCGGSAVGYDFEDEGRREGRREGRGKGRRKGRRKQDGSQGRGKEDGSEG